MNELATIVGYRQSPYHEDMVEVVVRFHYDGHEQGGGQHPKPGVPWGALNKPAPELLPVGTVVQY